MARCYNCGCDISEEDRTRLCDECKKIILPFVKFMDASSSSAVRRLVSNEENLRTAGVTDGGMEYLLRLCEFHDRAKAQSEAVEDEQGEDDGEVVDSAEESEEYEENDGGEDYGDTVQSDEDTDEWAEDDSDGTEELREIFEDEDDDIVVKHKPASVRESEVAKKPQYSDIEVPLDKPLRLIRREYGTYLTAAEIVLGIVAALLVVWFLIDLIAWADVDFAAIAGAITSGVMVYVTDVVRKLSYDIDEVKKHFR